MKNYAIITGAYGGLGRALSHTFAENGYGLILLGRKPDSLRSLKEDLSNKTDIHTFQVDVRKYESCKLAFDRIQKKNIPVDVLINNAAITYIKLFDNSFDTQKFTNLIDTNLKGPVYMSQLFFDDLIENKGSLINISSVLGYAPMLGRAAYVASKYGLDGFSKVLDAETEDQLHVMMVYPTFFESGIRSKVDSNKTVNEVLSAEEVAKRIYAGFKKKKESLYIGKTAKLCFYLNKYSPKLYVNLMRRKVGELN